MLFNIFLNDLFCHIKDVNIHAYADDEQLYDSDVDPLEPLNSEYLIRSKLQTIGMVHRKLHDRKPRQTPCYGFMDH